MSWRCDNRVCGGGDPFYAKGQTMLIASEKFYRLERHFYYTFTAFLLGTAQVFIESKSTGKIVKVTNSDMTTNRPSWSSNYMETAYLKFDIRETGDYRVIVSLKADINEGAMFNLQSMQKRRVLAILATPLRLRRMVVLVIVRIRSRTELLVNLRVAAVILSPVRVRAMRVR